MEHRHFDIHEDTSVEPDSNIDLRGAAADSKPDREPSEESDQSEEEDGRALEEIEKLNETFEGISDRFRIMKMIGEGTSWTDSHECRKLIRGYNGRYILDRLQSRRPFVRPLRE